MSISERFVYDGPDRYAAVVYPEIEAAVRAEFAGRLAQAAWLERLRLRRVIRHEIRRRVSAAVSTRALF